MVRNPEALARANIDRQLQACGWVLQDREQADIHAARGVAVREMPVGGFADYLLYVDGKAIGLVEAKPEGHTLTGVERQTRAYADEFPAEWPAHRRPLPFLYQSTGIETQFTNLADPEPRSREVFVFHRPETLLECVSHEHQLRRRLQMMPPLIEDALWRVQAKAIRNLEQSFATGRGRSLIQMATGSGKTFTAVNFIYRLVKYAGARRVLFLVDRGNLGRQTLKEFQKFVTPDDGRKFTELYNVQHLRSSKIDTVSRVCITTIQRLYSMLQGKELDPELEEGSIFESGGPLISEPIPVEYNPAIPIETFDFIVTDECHRSIYNLWRQVLDYFDAFLIGLTATPSKQTHGFFRRNLVMEYNHQQAVADKVNVDSDVYRISTRITQQGSTVEAGHQVDKRDRETRAVRWETLDESLTYDASKLDRDVVAIDQIRTVVRTFRDRLFTEIFPGRTHVPKTLIFAKDDSHADDIVRVVREEFGRGNEFCQKITYRTTGRKPEDLLQEFRNSYDPRIVVTVDMIATGTDIKPLEIVFFMRSVKSRTFFEQMKGRGVRVISDTDFNAVTPDGTKTHFVIVDAVGVCEACKTDSPPLERHRTVGFTKLIESVSFGSTDSDTVSSLAGRLARLNQRLSRQQQEEVREAAGGQSLTEVVGGLVAALDPDNHIARAKAEHQVGEPSPEQVAAAATAMISEAIRPLQKPVLRNKLIDIKRSFEQTIDTVSEDALLEAGPDGKAQERARGAIESFKKFIYEHHNEIAALEVLYSQPYRRRLTFAEVKELAAAIERPPLHQTTERLWHAYEALEKSKVRGSGGKQLTDIVSLVRHALDHEESLVPFTDVVHQRFDRWLGTQQRNGRAFTPEQLRWLERIRDHIAASMSITMEDFEYTPFNEEGGIGKVYQVFGDGLGPILDELNEVLAA